MIYNTHLGKNIKHLVITRLNIKMIRHEKQIEITEDWLVERMNLWRSQFLPSMKRQIEPPDNWIMLVDPATPKDIIEELENEGVDVVFSNGEFGPALSKFINNEECVTTRIDSDDTFSGDYCLRVHQWAEETVPRTLLNLTSGYKICGPNVYKVERKGIAFMSYLGKVCVYDLGEHSHLPVLLKNRIVYDNENPMWSIRIHSGKHSLMEQSWSSRIEASDGQPADEYPEWLTPDPIKVSFFARSAPHYVDHLAPIYLAIPKEHRGHFITTLGDRAASYGITSVESVPFTPTPIVVPSIGVLYEASKIGIPKVVISHGVGAIIEGDHFQKLRNTPVDLIIWSEHTKEKMKKLTKKRIESPGCAKLDQYYGRKWPKSQGKKVIAFSFHWDMIRYAQTRSSFDWIKEAIEDLVEKDKYKIIGHCHPADDRGIEEWWESLGVEFIEDFSDVIERADLFVNDMSSTLYEFASIGKPVMALSPPYYPREEIGELRFWEYVPGVECTNPKHLEACIQEALLDVPERKRLRKEAAEKAYGVLDGKAAQRAADLIIESLKENKKNVVYESPEISKKESPKNTTAGKPLQVRLPDLLPLARSVDFEGKHYEVGDYVELSTARKMKKAGILKDPRL